MARAFNELISKIEAFQPSDNDMALVQNVAAHYNEGDEWLRMLSCYLMGYITALEEK